MGGFKNQIIASQVEVGDRVPAPRPASSHVAFPERRLRRQVETGFARSLMKAERAKTGAFVWGFVIGCTFVVLVLNVAVMGGVL